MRNYFSLFLLLFSISFSAQTKKKDTLPTPKWKIHGRFAFIFNQSSFSNWRTGGINTIAGNLNVNYDFNYKKNNINWDTRLITSYGLSHLEEQGLRKTDDRFEINTLFGFKTSTYWFLSFIGNFRSQYTRGYNYKKEPKEIVSDFLAPAYLTLGPGMLWKKSDNFSVNIAPATARYTLVNDVFSGSYGVEEGRNTAFSLGYSLSGYYKFQIIATEALVKAIDSRAEINSEMKTLLMKRLEIEINYKKAKQIAKEEQRELREQQREEKKAREEAMKAQKEAEKEEAIKAAAIAKLEAELAEKSEQERLAYQEQLDALKSELALAHEKMERAKSRAQETKQGHVYIISNIGSFGEDVLKIGMTRRLEPMDRVRELGDASATSSITSLSRLFMVLAQH